MTQSRTVAAAASLFLLSVVVLSVAAPALADDVPPAAAPAAPAVPVAAPAAPPAAGPDLATRVADLEAYVTNGTPKALVSSGPGHNAWMMTSSALVLFMTLPGLALFYGGLVRPQKNPSVLAPGLGCARPGAIPRWGGGFTLP